MKLVKTLIGLSLFSAATVSADPVTSLTAGLFTFSNIQASNYNNLQYLQQADLSISATTISSSESGGISAITFETNNVPTPSTWELVIDFDVKYSGVDPTPGYLTQGYTIGVAESKNGGNSYFLINCPSGVCESQGNLNGTSYYLPNSNGSFELVGEAFFSYTDPSTDSSFYTLQFTADDANTTGFVPEPSSVGYYAIGFGALLVGAFRRYGVKSRRFD